MRVCVCVRERARECENEESDPPSSETSPNCLTPLETVRTEHPPVYRATPEQPIHFAPSDNESSRRIEQRDTESVMYTWPRGVEGLKKGEQFRRASNHNLTCLAVGRGDGDGDEDGDGDGDGYSHERHDYRISLGVIPVSDTKEHIAKALRAPYMVWVCTYVHIVVDRDSY